MNEFDVANIEIELLAKPEFKPIQAVELDHPPRVFYCYMVQIVNALIVV
ncbi:Uncharacterised protein [Acinetobacter haemolyticus]|nr:Uncharacterised protein [Acinetobacter haemolyticus]